MSVMTYELAIEAWSSKNIQLLSLAASPNDGLRFNHLKTARNILLWKDSRQALQTFIP